MTQPKSARKSTLSDALDAAMHVWARRTDEPEVIVTQRIEELYEAWAESRFAGDSEPVLTPEPEPVRNRKSDRARPARESKSQYFKDRAAFIVERFHTLRTKCRSDKEAHERIAAEIVEGRHLVGRVAKAERHYYTPESYSPATVKRILREMAGR
jgi:hypothetical protein